MEPKKNLVNSLLTDPSRIAALNDATIEEDFGDALTDDELGPVTGGAAGGCGGGCPGCNGVKA